MAFDMSTVKKIEIPGPLYKKKVYLTNDNVVYKGTATPCPVEVTIYSKTQLITTISNFYDYLTSCGYAISGSRHYLTVDNPYEFTYNNGTYDCVFASLQVWSNNKIYVWFSVPEATSTGVSTDWTITEDPWQEVGSYPTFTYEYKTYLVSTAGSYTNFTVGKNYITGDEYIANYCINGVSYPDVTIVSVSGDSYTLSNQEVITISHDYSSTFTLGKEVIKIQDSNDVVIWEKPYEPTWHTLWSGSQNVRAYGGYQQSGSVIGNNVTLVNAANVLSNSVQVRITFNTYQLTYPSTQGTQVTTWVPSPKVSSPWTKTLSSMTSYNTLLGGEAKLKADYSSTIYQDAWVYLRYKLTNNQLSFITYAGKNTNTTVGGKVNARIVITKIEAYY